MTGKIKFTGELIYLGPARFRECEVRRLPVLTLPRWYDDTRSRDVCAEPAPVLMGKNGRPRSAITMPGYGAGKKPLNLGRKFPPEPLTNDEALRLLAVIPLNTRAGVRNHALLTLLWRTGLRISEALDLRPHHVDFDTKRVTVLCGNDPYQRVRRNRRSLFQSALAFPLIRRPGAHGGSMSSTSPQCSLEPGSSPTRRC